MFAQPSPKKIAQHSNKIRAGLEGLKAIQEHLDNFESQVNDSQTTSLKHILDDTAATFIIDFLNKELPNPINTTDTLAQAIACFQSCQAYFEDPILEALLEVEIEFQPPEAQSLLSNMLKPYGISYPEYKEVECSGDSPDQEHFKY